MKKNILFIIVITFIALGVIATVIFASFLNGPSEPSGSTGSYNGNSENYSVPDNGSSDERTSNSGTYSSPQHQNSGSTVLGENIVNTARGILEHEPKVPFAENGASLDGFDNSGFIYYVLRENGFMTCPRVLSEQTKMAARLEYGELKPGDLVFFYNDDNTQEAGFGGIYAGGGKMIACLMPDTFVQEVDISVPYYTEHFYCGVSLS